MTADPREPSTSDVLAVRKLRRENPSGGGGFRLHFAERTGLDLSGPERTGKEMPPRQDSPGSAPSAGPHPHGAGSGQARAAGEGGWQVEATAAEVRAIVEEYTSLGSFIRRAVDRTHELLAEATRRVEREPERAGSPRLYRGPAWFFASVMKRHADLAGVGAREAARRIEDACPTVWLALPDEDSHGNKVAPFDDFQACWPEISSPIALRPDFEHVVELAEKYPVTCERCSGVRDRRYRRAVSAMFWLAPALDDGGRYYIADSKLGELLDVSGAQAGAYRRRAAADGLIHEREAHTPKLAKRHQFRYDRVALADGERLPLGEHDQWREP